VEANSAGKLICYEVGTCCRLSFYASIALVIRGIAASKYQILPPLPQNRTLSVPVPIEAVPVLQVIQTPPWAGSQGTGLTAPFLTARHHKLAAAH
jgi:hypothetical protein